MKILVTGSNGLLGQKLITLLRNTKRAALIATSKGENRYPFTNGYVYDEMDITSKETVENVIAKHKPDVIIHTAAITNVDICHEQHNLCREVNVNAVNLLTHICGKRQIHLIHLSTDFVFDGEAGPYTENASTNPISFYGESKRDAEEIIQVATCKWTIIRTILVYGITSNMSRSNIVLWAKSSLEKGIPINVVNDQWRTPTLAEDLAEACLLAAEKNATGIFHISGKNMMSIAELVEQVADFWKLDKTLIYPIDSDSLNQAAKRPRKTGFIIQKAIQELGYAPHSFQEGLQIQLEQMKKYN